LARSPLATGVVREYCLAPVRVLGRVERPAQVASVGRDGSLHRERVDDPVSDVDHPGDSEGVAFAGYEVCAGH
jgi:hypothetical protein